jgi:hypothetical protein
LAVASAINGGVTYEDQSRGGTHVFVAATLGHFIFSYPMSVYAGCWIRMRMADE